MILTTRVETNLSKSPRVFLRNSESLLRVRAAVAAGDEKLAPAVKQLCKKAQGALQAGPFSVVDKPLTPPSGDKHDYLSAGIYWWPDPSKPDGLPYIRRDGQSNPELRSLDKTRFEKLCDAVKTLALAFWVTGEEPYATRAAHLLRVWFLDEATRMNPHLRYAQGIRGINDGRHIGLIDISLQAGDLIDAIGLLETSRAWTQSDRAGLRGWMERYLDWLLHHEFGVLAANEFNNHGTHFDVQIACLALFVERSYLAREVLERVPQRRITTQIEPDGRQPHELARTIALTYSVQNLGGFFNLAALGQHVGLDLWNYQTPDGRGIRKAIDWLVPFAAGEKAWEHPQIKPVSPLWPLTLLRHAALAYGDARYERVIERLPRDLVAEHPIHLEYPQSVTS